VLFRSAEPAWRAAVTHHADAVHAMLLPGLTPPMHALNSGKNRHPTDGDDRWTALDPQHPVYNFLIEYYGLKGVKGPKRLARWSPAPAWILGDSDRMETLEELEAASSNKPSISSADFVSRGGILLEGATIDDVGSNLHLRGAMPYSGGVLYSPFSFFDQPDNASKTSNPYVWYRSVLQQTLRAEPVLHCHGLHEWAMQYWPPGADPPPSQQYQSTLPLRVSQQVINTAVERRGISCTHVDALRYFAPAAGPLNHHGASLERSQQLELEQPGCVHAHMDMLKHILRLSPYCDPTLVQRVLHVAIQARTLDVAASPYDSTHYGVSVIPIETMEGRAQYRMEQQELMLKATPVRQDLLYAYNVFLNLAFGEDGLQVQERRQADPERFARAEPGGLPWRRNLIPETREGTASTTLDRSEERRVGKECRSRWSPYH